MHCRSIGATLAVGLWVRGFVDRWKGGGAPRRRILLLRESFFRQEIVNEDWRSVKRKRGKIRRVGVLVEV